MKKGQYIFCLVYSLWIFSVLVSFCTKSGGLGADTLGLALLLSPDPGGFMGLSLALMTDYGCGTSLCTLMKASLVLFAVWLLTIAGVIC